MFLVVILLIALSTAVIFTDWPGSTIGAKLVIVIAAFILIYYLIKG